MIKMTKKPTSDQKILFLDAQLVWKTHYCREPQSPEIWKASEKISYMYHQKGKNKSSYWKNAEPFQVSGLNEDLGIRD